MNVRIAQDSVRFRLDPGDLAELSQGRAAVASFAAPGEDGEMREFLCELAYAREGAADVLLAPFALRVAIGAEELESLTDEACEGVTLTMEGGDGRGLLILIEKDRRSFPMRAGRSGGAGGRRKPGE